MKYIVIISDHKCDAENREIPFLNEYHCYRDQNNGNVHNQNLWFIYCSRSVDGSDLYHEELKSLFSIYLTENDEF